MTKKNVIDIEAYRDQQPPASPTPNSPPVMSEELKEAIESLIDKMRAEEPVE